MLKLMSKKIFTILHSFFCLSKPMSMQMRCMQKKSMQMRRVLFSSDSCKVILVCLNFVFLPLKGQEKNASENVVC